MLSKAKLPEKFWGEVINTSTYLQNRLPTKSNDTMIAQRIFLKKQTKPIALKHFRLQCNCLCKLKKKIHYKAEQGIFVGYDKRIKGYRMYIDGNNVMK